MNGASCDGRRFRKLNRVFQALESLRQQLVDFVAGSEQGSSSPVIRSLPYSVYVRFQHCSPAMVLINCMGFQQFDPCPFFFPFRKSPREAVYAEVAYAEVSTDTSHLPWIPANVLPSPHPGRPATPLTDGQEIPGSSWTPLNVYWHHSPQMVEAAQTPSIPNCSQVSPLPILPVTQAGPPWPDVNHPTVGTSAQRPSSLPAHSPSRDTPTPVGQSDGGSKGKKRSRGRYRKEDPADRYLRENVEDGNRLWTCMWIEPSHGASNSPAAQNTCGHQAPKSNARQHVKSRHLKLRYVSLLLERPFSLSADRTT